ncbi:DUF4168 domain-containing protein [Microbulbifer spongiae]|uniref:DUF4168 domain-containing protein n=1 Tax=Microbulbifer spongiae TaxID=2944933 RepID=A0ABY9E961_9GAMM|nr:DUF4168 domain-containing protein [Microbulbifer sp. MI-G]WKD49560.1 DUF4168 domain-containing protein [Microbulbifer sp. MI-G]
MKFFSTFLALSALLLTVPVSLAQPAAPQTEVSKVSFSEPQLKQFAEAYRAIVVLSREYAPKLKAASDIREAEALNKEAQGKMVAAIEKTGLSKSKYQEIANSIKSNPALLEKVNKLLQQPQSQPQ